MTVKRLVGELTVVLPDGYVERCIIKERGIKNFRDRLLENIKIILDNSPPGHVKLNYNGDFAAGIYDKLKQIERDREESESK